ncbi:fla cluster protein FlaF [Haladaptatus cibarius]|uniref:fla cluster protein FlaF n=1 Tax=Haladaptatus cibarius TaxID=453847 RepID=UPI000678F3BB|nr:fla cluster protein FlaF [Haladaptatus cibarius]
MGFSVSGATAIIFLAMFLSFGIVYSAAYNGYERVNDAQSDRAEGVLDQRNTALNITTLNYSGENLNVTVTNTGSTTLDVNDTDVLVDGSYVATADIVSHDVNGDSATELWLPGEALHFEISVSSSPARVKVVSGPGLADTEAV